MATGNGDGKAAKADPTATLTTRQGHPVPNNQNNRTVGDRGPTVLENYHFLEKISHFDRERVPERVVHARGTGAHGYFEAYGTIGDEPASKYTRASRRMASTFFSSSFSAFLASSSASDALPPKSASLPAATHANGSVTVPATAF